MLVDLERGVPMEPYPRPLSLAVAPALSSQDSSASTSKQKFVPSGYSPEYRVNHNGTLITTDPVLSLSADDLINFLELQASTPPTPVISISGTHTETRTRTTTSTVNGNTTTQTHTETVTVTDFSCTYEMTKEVEAGLGYAREGLARAVMYDMGDWDVGYRGANSKEKGGKELGQETQVTRAERKRLEEAFDSRKRRGMPLFVDPESLKDVSIDNSQGLPPPPSFLAEYRPGRLFQGHFLDIVEDHSIALFELPQIWSRYQGLLTERDSRRREIEQVARDYCASTKKMKELHVKKETYGWDWIRLEQEVTRIVRSTGYSTAIHFSQSAPAKRDIIIRPDNPFGAIFSARWYWKILLWLFLIYPVLLIVELFFGARFTSIRVAFPLCRWRPLPSTYFPNSIEEAERIAYPLGGGYRNPKVAQLPTDGSWVYMVGLAEDDWLRSFEGRLRNVVSSRMKGVAL